MRGQRCQCFAALTSELAQGKKTPRRKMPTRGAPAAPLNAIDIYQKKQTDTLRPQTSQSLFKKQQKINDDFICSLFAASHVPAVQFLQFH